jgi:Ca2+-binding RTX toxin-like protein
MLYKTTIGNRSSEFDVDNSSTQYVLDQGTTITSSTNGISEDAKWHLNTIQIDGTVNATTNGKTAVLTNGSETTVNIGQTGVVNGYYGVYAYGDYTHVTNDGQINGANIAVALSFADHSKFVNNGIVHGEVFVDRSDKVNVVLSKDSVVTNTGSTMDIATDEGQKSHVVNRGEITSGNWGVYMRDGDDTLVNRGTISGGMTLGEGNDVFDNRGGKIDHWVSGYGGDDTFIIDSKIDIDETAGGGNDTIKSTISLNLTADVYQQDEIENLTLLGNKDHNATGNNLDNVIKGNSGDNTLAGLGGADTLFGGKGADMFVFKTGDGTDTVQDFHNGVDHFNLKAWNGITDFADLKAHHLSVSGDDLIIHAGTDSLTIEHTSKSELDASDFVF